MSMVCPHCRNPLEEGASFCDHCGHAVVDASCDSVEEPTQAQTDVARIRDLLAAQGASSATPTAPADIPATTQEPPVGTPQKTANRTALLPLIALAGACVALVVVLVLKATSGSAPSTAAAPGASEQTTSATDAADEQESPAQPEPERTVGDAAADAYEKVLDQAGSYFAGAWYDQYPDSEITYTLMDIGGDETPELILASHYSNVGTHASGGQRWIPFAYDPVSDTAVEATSEEFSLFGEAWCWLTYDAEHHAVIIENRYAGDNMESLYYRATVSGAQLVRTQIEQADAAQDNFPHDFIGVLDRVLVDSLRSTKAAGTGIAGRDNVLYENEYFSVQVPDDWAGHWTARQPDLYEWVFEQDQSGSGAASIIFGNGLVEGYEPIGTAGEGMNAIGVSMHQEGDGFFGEGMATITMK